MDLAKIVQDATKALPSLLGTLMVLVTIDIPTLSYNTATGDNVSMPNALDVQAVPAGQQVFEDSAGIETTLMTFTVLPTVQGFQALITPLLLKIPASATLTHNLVKYNIVAVDSISVGNKDVAFNIGVSK